MFTFTALLGAQSDSRASQSILELDGGVKVLVDVGWDEKFDTRQLTELEKHVSTLSFILLTHATISHLGAFAHCCKHIPLFSQIPVYATPPVIAFGRTALQDLYSSAPAAATFLPVSATSEADDHLLPETNSRSNILREAPTFNEINAYFGSITPLKYSQPHQPAASYFSAPLEGLTLTAYNSGHTLGGTIWHIQHGMESIVYAVDWHQARENVVAGAAWFDGIGGSEVSEALRKPTALVCSSINGDKIALVGGKRARDEALIAHIRNTISNGGSILIPTDSSARILELAWLLEKAWQDSANLEELKLAKLYLASKSAHATLRHARSLLEWMDDSIVREFEGTDEDANVKTHKRSGSKQVNGATKPSRPFEFKHMKIVETHARLQKVLNTEGPRVILASDHSLEWGHSRIVLEHLGQKPENLVILTERATISDAQTKFTTNALWKWYQERTSGVVLSKSAAGEQIEQVNTAGKELLFRNAVRAPLDELELTKYQQYMATQRQIQGSLITGDGRQSNNADDVIDEDDESSSESEDDDEQQGRVLNTSAALGYGNKSKVAISDEDLGVSILLRKRDVFDYDVRNKKGRNAVFPYLHSRRRGDEFGDFIKPEDFLREEEKEAQESLLGNQASSNLGEKRKWSDNRKNSLNQNKRHKPSDSLTVPGQTNVEEDESEASDSESDVEDDAVKPVLPSKIVYEEKMIRFFARVAYVDFAGLHDQRSLQMLIPLINPKKLILISGNQSETSALANDCKELLGMKVVGQEDENKAEIYSPRIGEVIDASVDTNAWVVKLSRELAKRLQWQNVKNMSIVTITGQLTAQGIQIGEEQATKKLKLEGEVHSATAETEGKKEYEPVLDALPVSVAASTRTVAQPIHVGDLRLADLRRLMREGGHSAMFRGEGTLLIDEMIAVRKLASGRITVEGSPLNPALAPNAESFRLVKRKIYEGLAVVAAG